MPDSVNNKLQRISDPFNFAMERGINWLKQNIQVMKVGLAYRTPNGLGALTAGYDFREAAEFRGVVDEAMKEIFAGENGFDGIPGKINGVFETTVLGELLNVATRDLGYTQILVPKVRKTDGDRVSESAGLYWNRYEFVPPSQE